MRSNQLSYRAIRLAPCQGAANIEIDPSASAQDEDHHPNTHQRLWTSRHQQPGTATQPVLRASIFVGDITTTAMSDHHVEGHFPEEAEQNEIVGPVLLALLVLVAIVLIIWAMS